MGGEVDPKGRKGSLTTGSLACRRVRLRLSSLRCVTRTFTMLFSTLESKLRSDPILKTDLSSSFNNL